MADRSIKAAARLAIALGGGAMLLAATGAQAQSSGTGSSSMSGYRNGYSGSASEFSNPVNVSNADQNGNRVIVDGVNQSAQNGSVFYNKTTGGVGDSYAGAGGIGSATAIGNNLQVSVTGDHNVVIVNSSQTNTGAVTATTVLNGKVNLDANGG